MGKQIAILLVDPDQAFRESVSNLLLLCGVERFEVAATAEEALKKVSDIFFDFILVDLFMPQMSGLQLAREFQKRMPKSRILLVIEDSQQAMLSNIEQTSLDFPTILKSFVNRTLPQLLSEVSSTAS